MSIRGDLVVSFLVLSIAPAIAQDCPFVIRSKVEASNAEEICRLLLTQAAPGTGGNLEGIYDFETPDLGDGTPAALFRFKTSGDPLAAQPNYLFVRRDDTLGLVFDGRGAPTSFATGRAKVNGKWQIERVVEADVPGLYRKREVETWFWLPEEEAYRRAFTRVTIAGASEPKLNGTKMLWNPETEDAYRNAGISWTYTIAAGDTLGTIARRKSVPAGELARQNGISKTATLRIGQKLRYESWKVNAR